MYILKKTYTHGTIGFFLIREELLFPIHKICKQLSGSLSYLRGGG